MSHVSHTDRSTALIQVEHTSYGVGGGAVLGGSIASSSPDHENGEKLFNGLTPRLSTT